MKIEGVTEIVKELQRRLDKVRLDSATAIKVGFSASYAIYVHENLEAHHEVGQAKFLEQPARANKSTYARIVAEQAKKGRPLGQALMVAALQLQRDAQQLCPVKTGALRNSAFIKAVSGSSGEAS